ncbi:MAG: sensory protein TspO [Sideroxydans sp.]|nr:sensory protein TspO [Sideroxydans sp.]
MTSGPRSYLLLFACLVLVAGVAASGVLFQPGAWYAHLAKPFWTPPNWLFPPVWTVLYLMIAVAGWLILSSDDRTLKILWLLQLVLNGLWSWLFFGHHFTGLGLLDILALFATIGTLVVLSGRVRGLLRWLMVPYLVWVGYAVTLNTAVYVLNRG